MRKVLLIGSNGFIGRNLESYFSQKQDIELLTPKRQELNLLDDEACENYLRKNMPDKIIYSAVSLMSLDHTLRMFFNIYRHKDYYGVLYNLGSGAEYDKNSYSPLMKEEFFGIHIPNDVYGLGKFLISREIEGAKGNAVNLRIFAIYGRHEDYSRRFISNNICRVLFGQSISVNRNVKFDYIHVDDFCNLIDRLIEKKLTHYCYNVCTSEPVELLSLAKTIARQFGYEESVVAVKKEGMGKEYSGDNSRLVEEIGPLSLTPISKGVEGLIKWYQECKIAGKLDKALFLND